jgi:predicted dehydrogenase
VDIVVVTVRVPDHIKIVMAAIEAGKDIYCEWPLGRTLEEAERMALAAKRAKIRTIVGLQALGSPVVRQAAKAARAGALGRIISARMFAPSVGWWPAAPQAYAYLNDKNNGATLLTIPGGHTLAPMEAILGRFQTVQAQTAIHYPKVRILETQQLVDRNCADHLSVLGTHANGCVSTIEIPGNRPADAEFLFEVTGSDGELRITGRDGGGFQTADLTIETKIPLDTADSPVAPGLRGVPANVAELYAMLAKAIDGGTVEVADFSHAVGVHRLLDAIERAADSGRRQTL